jgi:hypothetical protein
MLQHNGRPESNHGLGIPSHRRCKRRESRNPEKTKTRKGKREIVELKAVKAFEDIFFVKLKSYLKATGLRVGLLMNFNSAPLNVKRVVV